MPTSDPGRAAVDLTRSLVAIDSVSPTLSPGAAGEAEIADHLADRLAGAGFDTRIVIGSDERRPSIVAVREGTRRGRTVVLNGHLDTVGVDGMSDPFTARIEGDRMHGRGTSDMKGGIAGLVIAAERLVAADAPGRLIVALVADEEDGSVGAMAVLEQLAGTERPDVCLIAEPTWLELAVAHRGYQVVDVALAGRAAHSSQPEEGVDVMPSLGALLVAISRQDAALRESPSHPLLSHGSLMATVARAGVAPFIVAARAEVTIERRTLPGESANAGLEEVRSVIDGVSAPAGLEWTVEQAISRGAWQADESGAAEELTSLLSGALTAGGGAAPARIGAPYWMESALWQEAGIPAVVCGPSGGGLHAADEWVDLAQLMRFPVAVEDAVGHFLSQSADR